jgi:hypothetical protein
MDLTVPEELVWDFDFYSDKGLMIMLHIIGKETSGVTDFFQDNEGQVFHIKTIESGRGEEISGEYILNSVYIDEGPPISVDIDPEPPMVRITLEFQLK